MSMYCVSDNEIQNDLTERQFLGLRSNIVDPKYKIFFSGKHCTFVNYTLKYSSYCKINSNMKYYFVILDY